MRPAFHPGARQALATALLAVALLLLAACEANKGPVDYLADAVGPLMPPKPAELARQLNDNYDADKRREAVARLSGAKFGGGEVYVVVYRKLMRDPDATVRAAAIKAVGLHGNGNDVPAILNVVFVSKPRGTPIVYDAAHYPQDQPQDVRWEVAQALQRLHNPIALPALTTMLTVEQSADVRMAAAAALGQYSDPLAFDALVAALDDLDFGVVEAAHASLVCLTGSDAGMEPKAWQALRSQNRATLFASRQPYLWQPYIRPHSFWDYVQFWKKYEVPPPQPPAGLQADAAPPGADTLPPPPTTAPAQTSSR